MSLTREQIEAIRFDTSSGTVRAQERDMSKADEPAFPSQSLTVNRVEPQFTGHVALGLTKREYFAAMFAHAVVSNPTTNNATPENVAGFGCALADASGRTRKETRMTREQIAAMLAGLDGVTPGPWETYHKGLSVCNDSTHIAGCEEEADAAHIARCDPSTIRALCTLALEGLDMQSALDQAEIAGGLTENGNLWRFWRDKAAAYRKQADDKLAALRAENEKLTRAMRNIKPYLVWTVGPESPGYHPTMPSAVAAFLGALERKPE